MKIYIITHPESSEIYLSTEANLKIIEEAKTAGVEVAEWETDNEGLLRLNLNFDE